MKSINLIVLALCFTSNMIAQTESKENKIGFGGPTFFATSLNGELTLGVGGIGGRFLNENIFIGGGGFGFSQKKNGYEYDVGYGGLLLGYQMPAKAKSVLNFYMLAGYGGVSEESNDLEMAVDGIWLVRPSFEVDFLILKNMRIGIGGGYRWVVGSNLSTVNDNDLSAPFGCVTFRFGNWQ